MHTLPTDIRKPLLLHGDCIEHLQHLPPASIDAIAQDPPAGIGFMGKKWDDHRGYEPRTERGRETMAGGRLLGLAAWEAGFLAFMFEVAVAELRVAKPGAHALSWALPRTADLTMLAFRLAGWEIRDSIVHLFGGGFPKSHNVSVAIDKLHGAEREVVGRYQPPNGTTWNLSRDESTPGSDGTTMGAMGLRSRSMDITAPATDDARKWAGWGTALSPGHELWILTRAPLDGTVARNVLAHGTGAINVDATRTSTGGRAARRHDGARDLDNGVQFSAGRGGLADGETTVGRWPKNAVLSCALACEGDRHSPCCPVRALDEMSGTSGPTIHRNPTRQPSPMRSVNDDRVVIPAQHEDAGGASRYFPRFGYHPKASDRTVPGRPDLTNAHPTHKHPELMRWLVQLVTPAGGIVLDPFMGSGTTGLVCPAVGVRFIGIEADDGSFDTAQARITYAAQAEDLQAYSPKRALELAKERRKVAREAARSRK